MAAAATLQRRCTHLGIALALLAPFSSPKNALAQIQNTKIVGETRLQSTSMDQGYQQSRKFGLGVALDVDHRFADDWQGLISVGAILETGTSQTLFSEEYQPQRELLLREASIRWNPSITQNISVSLAGGAINQRFHESPLLFSATALPAIAQEFRFTNGSDSSTRSRFNIKLVTEQAIPTGNTSSTFASQKESIPFYLTERLYIEVQPSQSITTGLHIGHFAFTDLPKSVAQESRFLGNSVSGIGPASTHVYGFEGVDSGVKVSWNASAVLRPSFLGSFVHNLRAPKDKATGYVATVQSEIIPNSRWSLTPSVSFFKNDSDSAPAYYNSSNFAHNNRKGFSFGLRSEIKSAGIQIESSFVRAFAIQENPFQSDYTGVSLQIGKSYDLL